MSEQSKDRECDVCFASVDEDGEALGECPAWGMPAQCDQCGACLCDGSC